MDSLSTVFPVLLSITGHEWMTFQFFLSLNRFEKLYMRQTEDLLGRARAWHSDRIH